METGRMRLRSQVSEEEKKQKKLEENLKIQKRDIDRKPFIQYKGKVKYVTTLIDCAMCSDIILKMVNESTESVYPIGFDLEWPFSFQTGSGKTAVMQLNPTLDECFILHISTLKNLPKSLTELLAHDKVVLTGVNIKNDIRKLSRDFSGVDVEKLISNCVDAGHIANFVLNVQRRWSMEKLIDEFFDMRINKDKKVRNSQWHIIPLSKEQQIYAAIDAYASLKLYIYLKQMEADIVAKENDASANNL